MNKGEIWLVEIPSSDGHEQGGTRPAIILTEAQPNIAIVVPCTSNVQALRFPFTIEIKPTNRNGLNGISVALVFHMRAVDKKRMVRKIGDLDNSVFKELDVMLKKLLQI